MPIRIPIYNINKQSITKAFHKIQLPKYILSAMRIQKLLHENKGVEKTIQIMNDFVLAYR